MPIVSSPVGTVLVSVTLVVALGVWLIRRPRHPGPRLVGSDGIDRDTLETAEREVRDLEGDRRPDDGFAGDDWDPGSSKPRSPLHL